MDESKKLRELNARADIVWATEIKHKTKPSKLLGSSEADTNGQSYWHSLCRTSFVAPNFYFERDTPRLIPLFNCIQVGEDRNDRPLYYFLANGVYAVSSDEGLLPVANSSEELFDSFITYAEWVSNVIDQYGPEAYINSRFFEGDLARLQASLEKSLTTNFKGSFWNADIDRLKNNIQGTKHGFVSSNSL